jgi:flagellin-like protein
MLERINMLSIVTYAALKGFIDGLKKDERGLSGVVVSVMLILVAVLAVALVWGLLKGSIQGWWEKITAASEF